LPALTLGSVVFESGQWEAAKAATPLVWGTLVWAGLISSVFATSLVFWLVQRREAGRVTPYLLGSPVVSILIGGLFMGDVLTPQILTGVAIALVGWRSRPGRSAACAPAHPPRSDPAYRALLLGLDDGAGHAVARAADGLAVVVIGVGVDNQGRAVGVQQPLAGAVLAETRVRGEDFGVHRAGRVSEDVGQVAVVRSLGIQQAVRLLGIAVVDVRAGRGEGRFALARGVDVNAVPAGRQARGLDLDQQTRRTLRQGRLADVGALSVDDGDLAGLTRRGAHHAHMGGVVGLSVVNVSLGRGDAGDERRSENGGDDQSRGS
jgi:hypothetical protein